MNTTPDEVMLALWLDDELSGDDLARVESWAATQPDQLAAREEVRAWRKTMAAALPAVEEPPYPDFFNSRVGQAIRGLEVEKAPAVPAPKTNFWRWLFPATTFAGMALAFWVGTQSRTQSTAPVVAGNEKTISPVWYTPVQGVDAKWVTGQGSSVIVLQGLNAIPDSMDFTETAFYQNPDSGPASTAGTSEIKTAR